MKEVRWRKFGHDRTYFKSDDGQDLGWRDNLTGKLHGPGNHDEDQVRTRRVNSPTPSQYPAESGGGSGRMRMAVSVDDLGSQLATHFFRGISAMARYATRLVLLAILAVVFAAITYAVLLNAGKNMIEIVSSAAPSASSTP